MSTQRQTKQEIDESIPTYEESVAASYSHVSDHKSHPSALSIQNRIIQHRAERIGQVVADHIEPWLLSHGLDGVAKRTLIVVPSDLLVGQQLSARNIVAPTVASHTGLIRLDGAENQATFWQQPIVLTELDKALREGLRSVSNSAPASLQSTIPSIRTPVRSWAKRTFGTPGPDHDPTGSTGGWNLGWKSDIDDSARRLGPEEAHILARLRETSFRFETELGLLATETVKCIWVEVEVSF